MEIKRDHYLKALTDRQHNGMIKIITGIRRCGKSYLLFKMFKKHLLEQGVSPSHIIEIVLDDRQYKNLRDPDVCYEYVRNIITGSEDSERYYILMDEVQIMPEFEDVLNSFLHFENADVYVTGSNSRFLSSDIITEFRGRSDEIRLRPLSFSEYYSAIGGDFDEAWEEYQTFGGMPACVEMKTDEQKSEYLKHLYSAVYLKDVVERNRIRNESDLDDLINILASSAGSLTNSIKIANTFQTVKKSDISYKTVGKYIRCLEDAFLISEAKRYDIKGRKYIGANQKYYFADSGLRNAKLNFRQLEDRPHIMENIIYNELLIRGFNVDVGVVEIFENKEGVSSRLQTEVDFVANLGSRRYYIQSAFELNSEEKRTQEKRSLLHIKDSFKKILIVRDNIKTQRDDNGFVTISLKNFLLNEDILDIS